MDTGSTSVPGGFGVPAHPDPRAVLDLWSQVPTGFDFLRERRCGRDQERRQVPRCGVAEGRGAGRAVWKGMKPESSHQSLPGMGRPQPQKGDVETSCHESPALQGFCH